MQAVKTGIKSAVRTPFKTALFTLLLTVTAVMLSASVSVFTAVRGYLEDCEEYFHTIARLEYVGRDYPDETVFDGAFSNAVGEAREDIEKLISQEAVISFSPKIAYLAYSPTVGIKDESIYDPRAAVLKLNVVSFDAHTGLWSASVSECLYSNRALTGKLIYFRADESPLGTVLAAGRFLAGTGSMPVFIPERTVFADGERETELPAISPVSDGEIAASYKKYAGLLHIKNDSCRAFYTAAIEDEPEFHQQLVSLKEGRLFTKEEYASRAHSVIISERFARLAELSVGSGIFLTVYGSDGDVYETDRDYAADTGEYEVVGIFREGDSFPWTVFLPDESAANAGPRPVNGYTVGIFRIENSAAGDFPASAKPLLENGFRVTVFDQGYSAAAEPMRELEFISVVFLGVSIAFVVSALALQSFLFVTRQRDAALIMRDLGSTKTQVFAYYLSSALLISAAAAVLGFVLCRLLEGAVTDALKRFAERFSGEDPTFSISRLTAVRSLAFDLEIPVSAYVFAALGLFSGSALTTVIFTFFILKKPKNKRKKRRTRRRAGRTSRLSGFLKYALLSARRGAARSLAVVLLCAAAGLFFARAAFSLAGYEARLEAYRDGARISGYASDMTGSRIDGAIVRGTAIEGLIKSGEIDEFSVTREIGHVRPLGVTVKNDGTEQDVPYTLPENGNQLETLFVRIEKTAPWSVCSSLEETPMFHFTEKRRIEWLEGFDDRIFLGSSNACAMPLALMEDCGIALGDTVRFEYASYLDDGRMFYYVNELKVVAGYASAQNVNTVFCPIGYRPTHQLGWNYRLPLYSFGSLIGYTFIEKVSFGFDSVTIQRYFIEPSMDEVGSFSRFDPEVFLGGKVDLNGNFNSFIFASNDANKLPELRRALAESFTFAGSPDRSKGFAVIEDEVYLNTTRSMQRRIQYAAAFSYALFALAWIAGFVLAWLMALSRKKEIALMRALGTPPLRIIANFLFEQVLLALSGVCLGLGFSRVTGAELSALSLILSAGFFALFCLSTLICVFTSRIKRANGNLAEPE